MKKGIAVLMSVYEKDDAAPLRAALHSIYNDQTLRPNQIVLVEDGPISADLDLTISEFIDSLPATVVVNRIRLSENRGLAAALNAGIEVVDFDLIARMDADDISVGSRFSKQEEFLRARPDVSILGCNLFRLDTSTVGEKSHQIAWRYPRSHAELLKRLHRFSPVPHPGVMIRTDVFKSGFRYDESMKTSQDLALWFELIYQGYKFANHADALLYFRVSDSFYTRRSRAYARRELSIYITGLIKVFGVSWRLYFPIVRYLVRQLPSPFLRLVYKHIGYLRGVEA